MLLSNKPPSSQVRDSYGLMLKLDFSIFALEHRRPFSKKCQKPTPIRYENRSRRVTGVVHLCRHRRNVVLRSVYYLLWRSYRNNPLARVRRARTVTTQMPIARKLNAADKAGRTVVLASENAHFESKKKSRKTARRLVERNVNRLNENLTKRRHSSRRVHEFLCVHSHAVDTFFIVKIDIQSELSNYFFSHIFANSFSVFSLIIPRSVTFYWALEKKKIYVENYRYVAEAVKRNHPVDRAV